MKLYDVQSVELAVAPEKAFAFIADARELPRWTNAFAEVRGSRARLRTPQGEVDIGLRVAADPVTRTIDWYMTFPDDSEADAYARVVPLGAERCVFSFVLTPPPVPLEQLEGTLEQQSRVLHEELLRLKQLLERDAAQRLA
jgi:hypothetical protein